MKLILISDTHNQLESINIPDGDVLIHAGDLTGRGSLQEVARELTILGGLKEKFKHIIFVPGNHDFLFERNPELAETLCVERGITLLNDSGTTIEGFNFWGSPVTPSFGNWAFNRDRGATIKAHWDLIPDGIDVLITHGPALGYGDQLDAFGSAPLERVGCADLLEAVDRVNPQLHVFGHIHNQYNTYARNLTTTMINASSCTEQYKPLNAPIEFTLHKTKA